MKALLGISVIVFLWLQFGLWFGQSGHFARERLHGQLEDQKQDVSVLRQKNKILTAQVMALKKDPSGLEARARHDLGMVKNGEVFYLIPDSEL